MEKKGENSIDKLNFSSLSDVFNTLFAPEETGVFDYFSKSEGSDTSGFGNFRTYFKIFEGKLITDYSDNSFFQQIKQDWNDRSVLPISFKGESLVYVDMKILVEFARTCRDKYSFQSCIGATGVHYRAIQQIHILYHMLSFRAGVSFTLASIVDDRGKEAAESLYSIYSSTCNHEREIYDMFGVIFRGHPSLTRIMMPDDWIGHPQRKDYPLGGVSIEYKDDKFISKVEDRRSYL